MEISKANSASSFRWKKMGIDSMFIRSRFFDSADRNPNETRFDRADIRMIDACQQSQWYLSVDILKYTGEMLITRFVRDSFRDLDERGSRNVDEII